MSLSTAMKRLLFIALAAIITFGACAATKTAKKKYPKKPKTEKLVFPKLPAASTMKQPIAKGDPLTNFRYERFVVDENGVVRSEVYNVSNEKSKYSDEYFTSLYYRRFGTYTENYGYQYDEAVVKPCTDSLAVAVAKLKLYNFPRNLLENEDKTRSRWQVEATYQSGNKVVIVEYTDNDGKADADFIRNSIVDIFENQIARTEATRIYRWQYKKEYKPDGNWLRYKRYNNEGCVCGGEDAERPNLEY